MQGTYSVVNLLIWIKYGFFLEIHKVGFLSKVNIHSLAGIDEKISIYVEIKSIIDMNDVGTFL